MLAPETDTEGIIEEEIIVSEPVVPETKDISDTVQQEETMEEKQEQRINDKPEPEKEEEPKSKRTKQEILMLKAHQEQMKRLEREQDYIRMAQSKNTVHNRSWQLPDFNQLIQDRKEQWGQQYGE